LSLGNRWVLRFRGVSEATAEGVFTGEDFFWGVRASKRVSKAEIMVSCISAKRLFMSLSLTGSSHCLGTFEEEAGVDSSEPEAWEDSSELLPEWLDMLG
jgi:hypothetical protein